MDGSPPWRRSTGLSVLRARSRWAIRLGFARDRLDTISDPCASGRVKPDTLLSSGNLAPRRRDVTEETAVPTADATGVRDAVTVNMPADSAYLSVLRTATAGPAARPDFTLDEIEDLRMRVSVSVLTADGRLPARDTFAWTVLTALAGDVDASVGPDDRVSIVLYKRRGTLESA